MGDERKTPPSGRPKTHLGDRNEGRQVVHAPPRGVGLTAPPTFGGGELAVPHEVTDPATGVVARGPKLDAKRDDRPPKERFLHIEHRLDDAADIHADLIERLASVEKSRDDLLKTIVEMSQKGLSARLDVGTADATARRDWITRFVIAAIAIAMLAATYYFGRSSRG